tara:strand:- start:109 stop:474 length:366 start_codon:yes stop_codon:yes gene_type:complete
MSNKIFSRIKRKINIKNLSYFAIAFVLFSSLQTFTNHAVSNLVSSDLMLTFKLLYNWNFLLGGLYFLQWWLVFLLPILGTIFSLFVYNASKEKFKLLEGIYVIIFSALFIVRILFLLNIFI